MTSQATLLEPAVFDPPLRTGFDRIYFFDTVDGQVVRLAP